MEAALHPRAVLRPLYEGVDHRWTIPQDALHMWLLVLVTRTQRLSSPSARSPYCMYAPRSLSIGSSIVGEH
jgi:hypothetical protein